MDDGVAPVLTMSPIDGNKLQTFGVPRLEKLRVLRVSDNALKVIELRGMPALRTLYADGNALRPGCIRDLSHLRRLENLSLRNQGNNECSVLVDREIRDVKRLYLSGELCPCSSGQCTNQDICSQPPSDQLHHRGVFQCRLSRARRLSTIVSAGILLHVGAERSRAQPQLQLPVRPITTVGTVAHAKAHRHRFSVAECAQCRSRPAWHAGP